MNLGFVVCLDVPPGTEVGIDLKVWQTGDRFRGWKLVPPGPHILTHRASSAGSSDPHVADAGPPRSGSWVWVPEKGAVVKKWSAEAEDWQAEGDVDESIAQAAHSGVFDSTLGVFPLELFPEWKRLTSHITARTMARLAMHRASHPTPSQLSSLSYARFPDKPFPKGSTPAEVTRHSMDATWMFQRMQAKACEGDALELLAELQVSFLSFLVGESLPSFEHWKRLLSMLCTCESAMMDPSYESFFVLFLELLTAQMMRVPSDFFYDVIASDNFLKPSLRALFELLSDCAPLKERSDALANHIAQRFAWDPREIEDDVLIV